MENTDYTLTAAVTTDVPVFYDVPVSHDDFVLPAAPTEAPPVDISPADMTTAEDVVASIEAPAPHIYWQDFYSGWGKVMLDDGDPLTDDTEVSQLLYGFGGGQFLTIEGKFITVDEWDGVLA